MPTDNIIKENTEINRKLILWACDNENSVSANYSNFLTTLAGFSLTLSPLVLTDKILKNGVLPKIFISVAILFIFLSLVLGGIYIFLKRKFFSKWIDNYSDIFSKWNNCDKEEDIKKVQDCESCIYSSNRTESPQWPLTVQSILLLLGISIIITIVITRIATF